jgi:hypothetical protein
MNSRVVRYLVERAVLDSLVLKKVRIIQTGSGINKSNAEYEMHRKLNGKPLIMLRILGSLPSLPWDK